MFLSEKLQNLLLIHGRGELRSPAGDRRSPLQTKIVPQETNNNPRQIFEVCRGIVIYVSFNSIYPQVNGKKSNFWVLICLNPKDSYHNFKT